MGHGFLYQSDAAGRIGAIFARSQNPHGRREKVGFGGSSAARGSPESSSKFAILSDSARYPSGPRERSAKPPFVGSNPTRASKLPVSNQWITTFSSFPESPTWKHLGTFGNTGEKGLFQPLDCAPVRAWNRMRVQVQRGLNGRVSQLLLRDLGGYADIVQDESVHVAKLMPRFEEIRTTCA